jgi:hypothetical protein
MPTKSATRLPLPLCSTAQMNPFLGQYSQDFCLSGITLPCFTLIPWAIPRHVSLVFMGVLGEDLTLPEVCLLIDRVRPATLLFRRGLRT